MRARFDQLGKRIGLRALAESGPTVAEDEIHPDARRADLRHEPDPTKGAERARLGLLGRLASVPCLIELYGHAPGPAEMRSCLGKHFASWEQRVRRERKRAPTVRPVAPFLWLLCAGRPRAVLEALHGAARSGWPRGVYFCGGGLLRVGIVVASELPRDRSTLLVRLMAAGRGLAVAIDGLGGLPRDAPERAAASDILLDLHRVLGMKPRPTRAEEELIVAVEDFWELARAEGREVGQVEAAARAVLTVLKARGITVSRSVRRRILAEKNPARLDKWVAKAAVAGSAAEVVGDPS